MRTPLIGEGGARGRRGIIIIIMMGETIERADTDTVTLAIPATNEGSRDILQIIDRILDRLELERLPVYQGSSHLANECWKARYKHRAIFLRDEEWAFESFTNTNNNTNNNNNMTIEPPITHAHIHRRPTLARNSTRNSTVLMPGIGRTPSSRLMSASTALVRSGAELGTNMEMEMDMDMDMIVDVAGQIRQASPRRQLDPVSSKRDRCMHASEIIHNESMND